MELIALILVPFIGGALAAVAEGRHNAERWITILSMAATVIVAGIAASSGATNEDGWFLLHQTVWAPTLGVSLQLGLDGISAALIIMAAGLGLICAVVSWNEITERSGLFHMSVCWTVATAIGVFLALDLLIFVFFFEAMLLPSFVLIALYGHENREAAGFKYLIFNAVGGLGLLAAVIALAAMADEMTFDAFKLSALGLDPQIQLWLLLAFSLAFLTKLPAIPLHAWLPDAHTEAPTAGSILLAGVLLKAGGYGLYRFAPMLFPEGLAIAAPWGMALGVAGALYGGLVACGQNDAKRLVAYTSVAHMGLVLLGIAAGTELARTGAAIEMVAHGFSAAALFLLVGALQHRCGTRDMRELGGLQQRAPRFAAAFGLFLAAALAMPGTANFVGEVLVIIGTFQVNWPVAVLAIFSLIISVVYATRPFGSIVFGKGEGRGAVRDLDPNELFALAVLAVGTLAIGLFPQFLVDIIEPSAAMMRQVVATP